MTNLHETDRLVERLRGAFAKRIDPETGLATIELTSLSLGQLAELVADAIDALTAMGGKAEPVGYIDRKQLDLIETQGRTDMATIWLEPYVPGHVPLFTSPVQARTGEVTATHRHKKRGTEYVLIGCGRMQAEHWRDEDKHPGYAHVDMREVAVYRSANDPTEIWVRPREEFEDGRFEALSSNESNKQ